MMTEYFYTAYKSAVFDFLGYMWVTARKADPFHHKIIQHAE